MSVTVFEWDRHVGTHMTPVDAVQNARAAGQSFEEYAAGYAGSNPSDQITNDELADGMVADMVRAAHNLANFRVTGSPALSQHSGAIFANEPDDPNAYYSWVETADEAEILASVNTHPSD